MNYPGDTNTDGPYTSEDSSSTSMTGGANRSSKSIIEHLFTLDTPYKNDILNVLQYSFTSLIPLVLLNKLIQYAIPEASSNGGTVELVMEIVGQLCLLIVGLIMIHRFATFFNTYSGEPYPKHSILCFILGLLVVLISIHSKLGEKINILFDRAVDSWNGTSGHSHGKHHGKHHKKHCSSQNHHSQSPDVQVFGKMAHPQTMDTTNISSLPVINHSLNSPPPQLSASSTNSSYATNYDPTNTASQFSGMRGVPELTSQFDEPSAANGVLGGSFGSAW